MALRVTFDLDEDDLEHFRLIMHKARASSATIAPEEIVAAAEELLASIDDKDVPAFIRERLQKLRLMIAMLSDIEWRLPHDDAKRVLNALAYFAEPEDLIPDSIPGLGFLDDAIMIELVVRELRHELDAYHDFCDFRDREQARRGRSGNISREKWLENRREELQARMRRRRRSARSRLFSQP